MTSEYSVAQQTQEKFQFYFLALVFTLLAAAIQTASFQRSKAESVFELLGWAGLLFAGLLGLWKMEWSAPIRMQMSRRDEVQQGLNGLKQQKVQGIVEVLVLESGQMQNIDDRIANYEDVLHKVQNQLVTLEKGDALKYSFGKYLFVFGLICLMASRSAAAVVDLFGYRLL
jgi:hypothetical protein